MLEQNVLDNIIRLVAEVAEPQKIILFGSVARGDAEPDSDVDLLIVKEGGS
jgi:predicted nucleotidyltransferase